VLVHHGIIGTLDPRAVFDEPYQWRHPWKCAGIHAGFIALAGIAGIVTWKFNEGVRETMRASQRELERLGSTDPLTSLGNRRRLMSELERVLAEGTPAVLAIFDLDGFKEYNDRFGHAAGDSLLVRLTARLRAAVGTADGVYRLGGDEFCVLSPDAGREGTAEAVAGWTTCFAESGNGFVISASCGFAEIPVEAGEASAALRLCDRRMYAAKHGRRATAARQTRDVLLAALAARHAELGEHSHSVAGSAEQIAEAMRLTRPEMQEIVYAAELHDVGKVAIPEAILAKPGPLDAGEWEFVRRHSMIGERIVGAASSMRTVARIVRATHERFDGAGYPDRTAGEAIPVGARIVCVCDAYDAMTSPRAYRARRSHRQALAELRRCAGTQFDPEVVRQFCHLFAQDPPGTLRAGRPLAVAPAA
jgi:two-component system, cell cycle response regulator